MQILLFFFLKANFEINHEAVRVFAKLEESCHKLIFFFFMYLFIFSFGFLAAYVSWNHGLENMNEADL